MAKSTDHSRQLVRALTVLPAAAVILANIIGTGVFSGFFSEPGPTSDPTFPGGVGMTYSLSDTQSGTAVSGALAFGNP